LSRDYGAIAAVMGPDHYARIEVQDNGGP